MRPAATGLPPPTTAGRSGLRRTPLGRRRAHRRPLRRPRRERAPGRAGGRPGRRRPGAGPTACRGRRRSAPQGPRWPPPSATPAVRRRTLAAAACAIPEPATRPTAASHAAMTTTVCWSPADVLSRLTAQAPPARPRARTDRRRRWRVDVGGGDGGDQTDGDRGDAGSRSHGDRGGHQQWSPLGGRREEGEGRRDGGRPQPVEDGHRSGAGSDERGGGNGRQRHGDGTSRPDGFRSVAARTAAPVSRRRGRPGRALAQGTARPRPPPAWPRPGASFGRRRVSRRPSRSARRQRAPKNRRCVATTRPPQGRSARPPSTRPTRPTRPIPPRGAGATGGAGRDGSRAAWPIRRSGRCPTSA